MAYRAIIAKFLINVNDYVKTKGVRFTLADYVKEVIVRMR